mmetsp:Transcript_28519/g.60761  ORF Transcript_28519/g.60761 Transcript_28519/m.60761 type:complete len:359 (-) Transcript_28519:124-1200(-)
MPLQQSIPRIVTLAEIEEVVSSRQFAIRLIDAIKNGFVSYSNGEFNACPIQTMGAPPMARFGGNTTSSTSSNSTGTDGNYNYSAQTCVKSGYVTSASHYVIKVASGGSPFPTNSGLMQLYSQQTGKLETILLDEGLLTELRTAAAGAVAAQMLAPHLENSSIGILGTGIQARYQLRYLEHVTECRNVLVWGRTEENVKQFIHDMSNEGWNVQAVDNAEQLLHRCRLVVTTTSSREPVLGKEQGYKLKLANRPLHITCMGSDSTGKVELDEKLIAAADLLVADCRLQTKERGEFEDAIAHGVVSLENVVEIGELALREDLHRRDSVGAGGNEDCRFTIVDLSGVAVQDCVVAMMVNEAI